MVCSDSVQFGNVAEQDAAKQQGIETSTATKQHARRQDTTKQHSVKNNTVYVKEHGTQRHNVETAQRRNGTHADC